MNIQYWTMKGALRNRQQDLEKIKSMINSAEVNAKVTQDIKINDNTATLVFREIYESIRQLGDAKLWLIGYEPQNHEVSMEILKGFDIKDKVKLNSLDRLKKIRHDVNYRGFRASIGQAEEILEFWNKCGMEISRILKKEMRMPDINCIIIHGCPSDAEKAMNSQTRTYDKHWIPWTKKQLIFKGIKVETPLMPEPWNPQYELFKKEFEKYRVDENSVLIGHSCGCAFLIKWLGETKKKIDKLILVAPWKIPDKNDELRKKFYIYPIDKTIKDRVNKIVMFTSDDEEEDGKKSLIIYNKDLDGKVIELKGHGHYTLSDMKTENFPELIEEVLN
ncbi:alpha/beta hydrolase [Candidatus Pacearchaeota archaeon]|nr:alpha/beta hydrolase [Candidatus Pacearchaeota archaeon]